MALITVCNAVVTRPICIVVDIFATVEVEDKKTGRPAKFLCINGEDAKLAGGTPKVLSVDTILKTVISILLTILTGISSWLLITVWDHSKLIVKNEARIDALDKNAAQMLKLLSEINDRQSLLLQGQARMDADLKHIKENRK